MKFPVHHGMEAVQNTQNPAHQRQDGVMIEVEAFMGRMRLKLSHTDGSMRRNGGSRHEKGGVLSEKGGALDNRLPAQSQNDFHDYDP